MSAEDRVRWALPALGWDGYVPREALKVGYGVAALAIVSGYLVDSPSRKLVGIALVALIAAGTRERGEGAPPPPAPPPPVGGGEDARAPGARHAQPSLTRGGRGAYIQLGALVALGALAWWLATDFAGVVLLAVAAAAGGALMRNVGNVRAHLPLFRSADSNQGLLGWGATWLVGLATVTCLTPRERTPPTPPAVQQAEARVVTSVVRAVDGDTLEVRAGGQQVRVRVLGVDTTELRDAQCFAREATARTQTLAARQDVWLEYDPRQRGRDNHGRDRVHVWLSDGTLLGWRLLREGYARVPAYPAPHRYEAEYHHAQQLARAEGRGGWRACSW